MPNELLISGLAAIAVFLFFVLRRGGSGTNAYDRWAEKLGWTSADIKALRENPTGHGFLEDELPLSRGEGDYEGQHWRGDVVRINPFGKGSDTIQTMTRDLSYWTGPRINWDGGMVMFYWLPPGQRKALASAADVGGFMGNLVQNSTEPQRFALSRIGERWGKKGTPVEPADPELFERLWIEAENPADVERFFTPAVKAYLLNNHSPHVQAIGVNGQDILIASLGRFPKAQEVCGYGHGLIQAQR